MPRIPFEIGGGAIKLNEQEIKSFFDAAERSVIEVLGIDSNTMNATKDHLEENGTYFRLRAAIIRDGESVLGHTIIAEFFMPQDNQAESREDEDILEVEDELLSFDGSFVELRLNSIDNVFHRLEGPARLVLDVMGSVRIEEGVGAMTIHDSDDEGYEKKEEPKKSVIADDGFEELLEADSHTPKTEDYMVLNEIIQKLTR